MGLSSSLFGFELLPLKNPGYATGHHRLSGYSYASQQLWNGSCNTNGKRQSPINIDTTFAIPSNLIRASFTTGIFNGEVENTGHAAEIVPDDSQTLNPNTLRFQLCPGGTAELYRLQNCHIHWGQSEHAINGQAAYAEIHCVFQLETTGLPANRKYAVFAVVLKDQCFSPDPGVTELLGKMLASDQPTFVSTT